MHTFTPDSRPRLRYGLAAKPHGDRDVALHDTLGVGRPVVVSRLAVEVARRFDGESTVAEIAAEVRAEFAFAEISPDVIAGLAAALDDALLLDSPKLLAHLDTPIRKPGCLAPFGENPGAFREQLAGLFAEAGMPGERPGSHRPSGRLRAVLAPHMDYGRGNVTYGHAFKELVENSDARVFVIVGTSHYSPSRFSLSRQHFDTPLGLVDTDQDYVGRIVDHYGDGLLNDPVAHVPEHSIELEVALLQFLLAGRRPFRIVPLLTGSIHDLVMGKEDPGGADDVARMVAALREAEAACPDPVCYVISGDLAHIGPKFGDERKAEGPWLAESRTKDAAILKTFDAADPAAFFGVIAGEENRRRICGLSPAWLTLAATRPTAGKVLHYQQYVHPKGHESVSFAAAAFYG